MVTSNSARSVEEAVSGSLVLVSDSVGSVMVASGSAGFVETVSGFLVVLGDFVGSGEIVGFAAFEYRCVDSRKTVDDWVGFVSLNLCFPHSAVVLDRSRSSVYLVNLYESERRAFFWFVSLVTGDSVCVWSCSLGSVKLFLAFARLVTLKSDFACFVVE